MNIVEDYAAIEQAFNKISALGVRLAVDDAGAGYTSFRYIISLMPDIVEADIT